MKGVDIMPNCFECLYKCKKPRNFGNSYHCILEPTNMDVSYFCQDRHREETNTLCPFLNKDTGYPGVDYRKILNQ